MKMICFGDSNTFGYDPCDRRGEPYDCPWPVVLAEETGWLVENQGVNGREVPREPVEIPLDTDLFTVMLGTNDLLQLDTPEAAAERMQTFLSGGDRKKLLVIAPPPMVYGDWVQDDELIADSIRLAKLYELLCRSMSIRFLNAGAWNVPISYDGVHFTQDGHAIFAHSLLDALRKGE